MLWALTAYFNPQRYTRRLQNYRVFRAALEVPLLAVELAFDGEGELGEGDAEVLVRVPSGDVLWQKERLLNVGLAHLPADCTSVLCVDCDLVCLERDWPARIREALARAPVVQAFSSVRHLGPDFTAGDATAAQALFEQPALAAVDAPRDTLHRLAKRTADTPAVGHAWAYRRDVLTGSGLFDSCIIGGGDSAIACAAFEDPDACVRLHGMTAGQARRYRRWAAPFAARNRGRVGTAACAVGHLWHGRMADRQPRSRHAVLAAHDFDPHEDVRVNDHGAWVWNSSKPALHEALRRYFADRREDTGRP